MTTFPTAGQMINMYLFGSLTTPADLTNSRLIRGSAAFESPVTVDRNSYMTSGPGRFTNITTIPLIKAFFDKYDPKYNGDLERRTYSKDEFVATFGVDSKGNPNISAQIKVDQKLFGITDADYMERVLVWNNTAFNLTSDTKFIIDANGKRSIQYGLQPYVDPKEDRAQRENFDFVAGDDFTRLLNPILKDIIDPSGIGRKVFLPFSGTVSAAAKLTEAEYISTRSAAQFPLSMAIAAAVIGVSYRSFFETLYAGGSIKFLDSAGRMVAFGTSGNDDLTNRVQQLLNTSALMKGLKDALSSKGITLVAGDGDDTLAGGVRNDLLLGGAGVDTYRFDTSSPGGFGSDTILDSDGRGIIFVTGIGLLTGASANKIITNVWQSSDKQVTYSLIKINESRSDLHINFGATDKNKIIVENWSADLRNFGIMLNPNVKPLTTASTYNGDFIKALESDGITYARGNDGNFVSAGVQASSADLITGSGGNDLIQGFGSDDALLGRAGDDFIDGSIGNDIVMGGLGADTLIGGLGSDVLYGSSSGGLYYPADTNYVLTPPNGTIVGRGFSWYTSISGQADGFDNTLLTLTVQRDQQERDGSNVIDGGPGADVIFAGTGSDIVQGGDDSDQIFGMGGGDILFGDAGRDLIYGDGAVSDPGSIAVAAVHGADLIVGGEGDDVLLGQGNDDTLIGGGGNDRIYGDDQSAVSTPLELNGNDWIESGDGDDSIFGGGGQDTLNGGSGADYLAGGEGDDLYIVSIDDAVVVNNVAGKTIDDAEGNNVLAVDGLVNNSFKVVADSQGSLYIQTAFVLNQVGSILAPTPTKVIAIARGLEGSISTYRFADGSELPFNQLVGQNSTVALQFTKANGEKVAMGGSSNESLTFYTSGSLVSGGYGNDAISLYGSLNTVIYSLGDGEDHISLGAKSATEGDNVLKFTRGINVDDIRLDFSESVAIQVGGLSGYKIHLDGFERNSTKLSASPIDRLVFHDGTQLTLHQLIERGIMGTPFNDKNIGSALSESLYGLEGSDTLVGAAGDDTLVGGQGDDEVSGGNGSDVYRFGLGDGHDNLLNVSADGASSTDVIELGSGILPGQVVVQRVFHDLIVKVSGIDNLTLKDYFLPSNISSKIDLIKFADGQVWTTSTLESLVALTPPGSFDDVVVGTLGDDILSGLHGRDILVGGPGADSLFGGDGDDVYLFSRGNGRDIVSEGGPAAGFDQLYFDATFDPSKFGFSTQDGLDWDGGNDLVISYGPVPGSFIAEDVVTVRDFFSRNDSSESLDRIVFADGGSFGVDDIWEFARVGDKYNYVGSRDNNSLPGTRARDVLDGLGGDDHVYGFGGDDNLSGGEGKDSLYGHDGDDRLQGDSGDDFLHGGAGADTLDGGPGNDTLHGGIGNDVYLFGKGDGQDLITATTQDTAPARLNTLQFKAGVVASELRFKQVADIHRGGNRALEVSIAGTSDKVIVSGFFSTSDKAKGYDAVQQIRFADGSSLSAAAMADLTVGDSAIISAGGGTSVPLGSVFTDLGRAETLSFRLERIGGQALPGWVRFNPGQLELSATPVAGDVGVVDLRLTAQSPTGESASQNFRFVAVPEGFNPLEYTASYGDLRMAFGADPLAAAVHYVQNGRAEGRSVSFSALRYLASNADLMAAFGLDVDAAATHYITRGHAEARPLNFDGLGYLASNPDLIAAFGLKPDMATAHYVAIGHTENRPTRFDALRYIASYPDLIEAFGLNAEGATSHYISNGYGERRTLAFNPLRYLASNLDLVVAFGTNATAATQHYIGSGLREGRSTTSFDPAVYLQNYADLRSAFGTDQTAATLHYINVGRFEGRRITPLAPAPQRIQAMDATLPVLVAPADLASASDAPSVDGVDVSGQTVGGLTHLLLEQDGWTWPKRTHRSAFGRDWRTGSPQADDTVAAWDDGPALPLTRPGGNAAPIELQAQALIGAMAGFSAGLAGTGLLAQRAMTIQPVDCVGNALA